MHSDRRFKVAGIELRRGRRGSDSGRGEGRDERGDRRGDAPTVLIEAKEWVSASAEQQTNSLIISANRKNMLKIERIVEQLDVPEFAKLPAPRLIPVGSGDPDHTRGESAGDVRGG